MCGGPGTRLDRGEKQLYEVAGEAMVDRVLRALETSRLDTIYAVTAPHAPDTISHLEGRVPTVATDGEGYVSDLGAALEHVDPPVLTVVSDLPLLDGEVVDRALDAYGEAGGGSLTVAVPTALKEILGVTVDTTRMHGGRELSPSGLNVVGPDEGGVGEEHRRVSYDARLAVDVDRPADASVAEVLADGPR